MIVGQSTGDDGAIVLVLAQTKAEPLARCRLGYGHQQFVVCLSLPRSPNDDGQACRTQDCLDGCGGLIAGRRIPVGVGPAQLEHNQISTKLFGLLGPSNRVSKHVPPCIQQHRGPVAGVAVLDLDADDWRVRHLPFEEKEGQGRLTAYGHGFRPRATLGGSGAESNLSDRTGPPFLWYFHCYRHRTS